jgi:hypothetical protein
VRTVADNEASKVASKEIGVSRNSYISLIKSGKALPSTLPVFLCSSSSWTESLPSLAALSHYSSTCRHIVSQRECFQDRGNERLLRKWRLEEKLTGSFQKPPLRLADCK